MKCPKCGYISFDHNQICPKCTKDISSEQQKLNIPAFRPEPPLLLGALLGEAGESGVHMGASTEMAAVQEEHEISMGDSSTLETGEVRLDDSQEMDLGLDLGAGEEAGAPVAAAEEPALDLELEGLAGGEVPAGIGEITLSAEEGKPSPEGAAVDLGDDLALDLGDLSGEARVPEEKALLEALQKQEEKLEIDLGDLSLEEGKGAPEGAPREGVEPAIDLDAVPLKAEEELKLDEADEIALNLDDLKVNATGELEIGKAMASLASAEKPLDLDSLELEQEPPTGGRKEEEEEDLALLLGEEEAAESGADASKEEALDLDNLDLELDLEEPDRK